MIRSAPKKKNKYFKRLNLVSAAFGILLFLCLQNVGCGSASRADLMIDNALVVTMDGGMRFRADLIIIGLNSPHLVPLYNIYSHLVYATNGADVETVIIDGNVVMQDRKLLTLDEKVVMQEARAFALEIAKSE